MKLSRYKKILFVPLIFLSFVFIFAYFSFYAVQSMKYYSDIYEHSLIVTRATTDLFENIIDRKNRQKSVAWDNDNGKIIMLLDKKYHGPKEDISRLKTEYEALYDAIKKGQESHEKIKDVLHLIKKIRNFEKDRIVILYKLATQKKEKAVSLFYILIFFVGVVFIWGIYNYILFINYSLISKDLDRKLEEFKTEYKNIVENINELVYIHDMKGVIRYVAPVCKKLGGYKPADLIGKNISHFIHPEDLDNVMNNFKSLSEKDIVSLVFRVLKKDGSFLWVRASSKLLYEDGFPKEVLGTLTDITKQKEAEEETTVFFNMINSSINEAYIFSEKNLKFVYANVGALKNLGYSLEELKNMTPLDIKPQMTSSDFEKILSNLKNGSKKEEFFNTIHRRKDNSEYPVEVHLRRYTMGLEGYFVAIILDITEKKIYENNLEKMRLAIEQSGDTVVITDTKGNIEYANPAFEKISGYSRSEAIGLNPRILKSGKQDIKFYKNLWDTINSGLSWSGIIVNKKKDGSLYTEETVISPVFDKNKKIINFVAVKRDITDKIKTQEKLLHLQKMEAIGVLASSVAHDFNNVLTAILSYAQLLLKSASDEKKDDINEIIQAAQRGVALTRQLLAFSRKQVSSVSICDINATLKNFENMLARIIGENIRLLISLCPENCSIMADPSQVEQIIMNLVINSRDAIEGNGNIEIKVEKLYGYSEFGLKGNFVKITVKDDGRGFDEEAKKHVFEPFFTTKEKGKGTGLGLSTVFNLVKQNKGEIKFESEKGRGTIFSIFFPEAGVKEEKHTKEEVDMSLKGRERILIVEDEGSLLKLVRRMLEGLGYNVFTANNGEEAIKKMKEIGSVDLLITDLVMPGMNGKDLSDILLKEGKTKKVIFMSGYTDDIIGKHGMLEEGVTFIYKPFSVNSFLLKVRETLDRE